MFTHQLRRHVQHLPRGAERPCFNCLYEGLHTRETVHTEDLTDSNECVGVVTPVIIERCPPLHKPQGTLLTA